MTEEEAKVTRCCGPEGCGVWGWPPGVPEAGRMAGTATRYCAGSGCMAWRWDHRNRNPVVGISVASGMEPLSNAPETWWRDARQAARDNGYVEAEYTDYRFATAFAWKKRQSEPCGYCGLASKP